MQDEQLTPQRVKEILADTLSIEYGEDIVPQDIEMIVTAEKRIIDISEREKYVGVFQGARINRRNKQ